MTHVEQGTSADHSTTTQPDTVPHTQTGEMGTSHQIGGQARKSFRWLTIQLAAAIVLAGLVGGLTLVHLRNQGLRDTGYQQVVDAAARGDHYAVLMGAEVYLDHPPLMRDDDRRVQVVELYSQALVRWFIITNTSPSPDRQERVDRYRELVVNAR